MATRTIETVTIEINDRKTGEMRKFHVVVVQRHSNVQKSVMLVQSCCFADLNLWLFFFAVLVIIAVIVAQALLYLISSTLFQVRKCTGSRTSAIRF